MQRQAIYKTGGTLLNVLHSLSLKMISFDEKKVFERRVNTAELFMRCFVEIHLYTVSYFCQSLRYIICILYNSP